MTILDCYIQHPVSTRPDRLGLAGPVPPLDRYRGALIGAAIGDALGAPLETKRPDVIRRRHGVVVDYLSRGGRVPGSITDDTQMTMCVARSIVSCGDVDGEDLTARFIGWLPHGRGKGRSCTQAVHRLMEGRPWTESGVASAGNGGAMRVAPVGLRHISDPTAMWRAACTATLPTHADRLALLSSVLQAWGVAYCAHRDADTLDPSMMLRHVATVAGPLVDAGAMERKPGGRRVTLIDRLAELEGLLDTDPETAFAVTWNGAFVLESLPAAWWAFLRYPEDPEQAIITAANGGFDADTVASMAGALAGAYHGYDAFPMRWLRDIEFHDELLDLADALHGLAVADAPALAPQPPSHRRAWWLRWLGRNDADREEDRTGRAPSQEILATYVKEYLASDRVTVGVAAYGLPLDVLQTEWGLTALSLEDFTAAWRSLSPVQQRILLAYYRGRSITRAPHIPEPEGHEVRLLADQAFRRLTGRDGVFGGASSPAS